MLIETIYSLYQYNRWANQRILQAAAGPTAEQLAAPAAASFDSLRDTLVHTMSAEWIWLSRWQGTSPRAMFDPNDFPTLASIQTRWNIIEEESQQFIERLKPEMLAEIVTYVNTRGEKWAYALWQQMIHQVNHATQHRSEAAVILTQMGHSPGAMDYLFFVDQQSHGR